MTRASTMAYVAENALRPTDTSFSLQTTTERRRSSTFCVSPDRHTTGSYGSTVTIVGGRIIEGGGEQEEVLPEGGRYSHLTVGGSGGTAVRRGWVVRNDPYHNADEPSSISLVPHSALYAQDSMRDPLTGTQNGRKGRLQGCGCILSCFGLGFLRGSPAD